MMELLYLMRKEMEDKNKQLKLHLQWRDEYIDKELSRRDKFWEQTIIERDEELKERDIRWAEEMDNCIRVLGEESEEQRDALFNALEERDTDLRNRIVDRDTVLKNDLTNRDRIWIYRWQQLRNSLRLTHVKAVNNRTLLESLGKRQKELVEANTKILNWAMKAVSDKKQVPLPQFRMSNCVPYTVVPLGLDNSEIRHFFSYPSIVEQEPLAPCRVLP